MLETARDLESRLEVRLGHLTDLSDASLVDLSTSDLVALAEGRKGARFKNKIKSAIIAPRPLEYGLARMFMTFNQNPAIEIMLFRDSAGAQAWLGLRKWVGQNV
jgi:hypothetical protein